MQIAILGNEGSWYVDDLHRAAQQRNHACQRVDFRRLTSTIEQQTLHEQAGDCSLSEMDAIIVRTMPPGTLEQVVYRMNTLIELERAGVTVLNPPRAIECAVDKFLTTARLSANQLQVPRTVVCESTEDAMEAFAEFHGDVVVKPIFGAEGRGIFRVSDTDLAFRSFRVIERLHQVIYLQEFIAHQGFDIRVMVLDGNILGGMKRSHPTDFRTNVSREGAATVHEVTDQEAHTAITATRSVQATFAGVDLLYDADGICYVIEVNAVPGWRAFSKVNQIDVADLLIQSLEK